MEVLQGSILSPVLFLSYDANFDLCLLIKLLLIDIAMLRRSRRREYPVVDTIEFFFNITKINILQFHN